MNDWSGAWIDGQGVSKVWIVFEREGEFWLCVVSVVTCVFSSCFVCLVSFCLSVCLFDNPVFLFWLLDLLSAREKDAKRANTRATCKESQRSDEKIMRETYTYNVSTALPEVLFVIDIILYARLSTFTVLSLCRALHLYINQFIMQFRNLLHAIFHCTIF